MSQHRVSECVVAVLATGLLLSLSADRTSVAKPNVILVMADDLGIGDISPTNPDCRIKTPHLQQMANEGLTFLDAHTPSSVCTPTRYGLLTGRYNWRSRLTQGVLSGTSSHLIPEDRPTLGHMMRNASYHTAMIGKWHLGWDWHMTGKKIDFTKSVKNGPDINGFDQYYGHCSSLDMPPYVWVDTGQITAPPDREEGVTKAEDRYGWYRKGPIGSDFNIPEVLPHLFDKSMDYVKSQAEHAKEGKPFFLYLALPAPHTPIVPVPPYKDASGLNPYADFVMQLDDLMGQLLHTVKESGLDDNMLVIFTSDNGCSPEANFPLLQEKGHNPSGKYRGHKADIYEGGHRVPFIVRWPGEIEEGRKTEAMTCLTDVYATLEAITGQEKQTLGGEDGYSLLPVFQSETSSNRDTLISHSDYVLSWLREEKRSKSKTKNHKGGQRKPRELRELVIEIAKTTGFGYTRIIEELRMLEIKNISRQTVRNILKEEEIQPGPDRTSDSWTEFLNRHGEILWANDFFSVKSMTARGLRDIYVMVFLNLQTREAIVTESTCRPNSAWVCRQTKMFTEQTRDREKRPAILIHDRDSKYTKKFRETDEAAGMKTNPLPKASPNLNGRCERFIETIKLDCLNKFIVFGKKHLDYLTDEFTSYYNTKRSHIERDQLPQIREEPDEVATISIDQIEFKKYVSGLIKTFERKVA